MAEFRCALEQADAKERHRLVGKLMREARDPDVWRFVTPREVWANFASIERYLGRRRSFWSYLLTGWHRDGLLVHFHRLAMAASHDPLESCGFKMRS